MPDPAQEERGNRRLHVLSLIVLAFGVLVRAVGLLRDRPLRYDEAALALNLVHKPAAALLQGLDSMQSAPPGFLLLERFVVHALGSSELVLRLLPFAAAVVALVLYRTLATRVLGPAAGLFALALMACSDRLIFHATDAKQYSLDVLAAVVLLALALRAGWGSTRRRDLAVLALAGVLLLTLSHPSCFVLAAIGANLLAHAVWRRERGRALLVGGIVSAWLLSFVVLYALSLRLSDEQGLREFWREAFLPFPPRSAADWAWWGEEPLQLFRTPGGITPAVLGLLLCLWGARAFWRGSKPLLVLFALPLVAALVVSAPRLYPFHDRFLVFGAPGLFLLAAAGVRELDRGLRRFRPNMSRAAVRVALVAALLWASVSDAATYLVDPRFNDPDWRAVLAAALPRLRPHDRLYVPDPSDPALTYYRDRLGRDDPWTPLPRPLPLVPDLERVATRRRSHRAWFVFTYPPLRRSGLFTWRRSRGMAEALATIEQYKQELDRLGFRVATVEATGTTALMYEFSRRS